MRSQQEDLIQTQQDNMIQTIQNYEMKIQSLTAELSLLRDSTQLPPGQMGNTHQDEPKLEGTSGKGLIEQSFGHQ